MGSFYYLSPGIIRALVQLGLMVPLITFYLEVEDVALYGYLILIATTVVMLVHPGTNLVVNSHYYRFGVRCQKRLIFNLWFTEYVIRGLLTILLIIFADQILSLLVKSDDTEIKLYFSLMIVGLFFAASKTLVLHWFVVNEYGRFYMYFQMFETGTLFIVTAVLLYFFELGLYGVVLGYCISQVAVGILGSGILFRYFEPKVDKRWQLLIFHRGIKLFYTSVVENIKNLVDSFLLQKYLSLYHLGIYTHAKTYSGHIGMLDKAYFLSLQTRYFRWLNNNTITRDDINHLLFWWYVGLLLGGVLLLLLAEPVISFITHGKFAESADVLEILYLTIFFRSNQQLYSYQLLNEAKNTIFALVATVSDLMTIVLLIGGVVYFDQGLYYVASVFVANTLMKNAMIKLSVYRIYRSFDVSEKWFVSSLSAYLCILLISNSGGM